MMPGNKVRLLKELQNYRKKMNVHDLPEIYHYWSNKYLKPILEIAGILDINNFYIQHIQKSISQCGNGPPVILSIGSGNCDTEVSIAKTLLENGIDGFSIECLELNSAMLKRGLNLARSEGVDQYLLFSKADINEWKANKEYVAVMANHSLHHIFKLEDVFEEIIGALHSKGSFITNDMIGRNGHKRWPEALEAVHHFWHELPHEYKYNHKLKRFEEMYENWDCSTRSYEGIRSQDILPLLIEKFHFQLFIGFSNVIDVFIDRCFGHNFSPAKKWDTSFIDRVHAFDEKSICSGSIKPTHMLAVLRKTAASAPHFSRNLTPSQCVRV